MKFLLRLVVLSCLLVLGAPSQVLAGEKEPILPVVIPGVSGTTTSSKFDDGFITRTSDGKTFTTTRYGNDTISRESPSSSKKDAERAPIRVFSGR